MTIEEQKTVSALEQLAILGGEPQVWLSIANGEFTTFCIRDNLIHFGSGTTVEEAVRQAREVTA